jgi:glycosidase
MSHTSSRAIVNASRLVIVLPILTVLAGCPSVPPNDADGGTDRDASRTDGAPDDGAASDAPVDAPDAGPPVATWDRRSCSVTVSFAPAPGATSVLLAGDFTGWGDAPLPMTDADGDGVYTITVGPENGLVRGQLHAYRVVVDGAYLLDPAATHRKYDGACINSGLLAPACDAGPEIVPLGDLTSTFDATSHLGRASVRVAIHTATDRAVPTSVTFTLDGAPIAAGAAVLDEAHGAYDVTLEGVAPGRHLLSIRATDASARDAEPIDLPFWIEEHPFEWRDATMYMIVVDRFANGDASSDAPVGAPVEYPADFHGGDLDGILAVMRTGYFESLGVNALWLSPINQQAEGAFTGRDDGRSYAGYHGYWPSRGQQVEPRFGGGDALHALIEEAHARGIRVLLDLINNQIHQQHEYFSAHPDWFRTGCVCGLDAGCGWSERPLDCLFAPYLPDIDWRVPGAEAQFTADALHWIEAYGIDGFRIDAVKHVETNSIVDLRAATARRYEQAGYRHYFVGETAVTQGDSVDYGCGEHYANGYEWLDAYTGETALDGQFDFPTHHRTHGLVDGTMGFDDVEAVVSDAQRFFDPAGLHVRFLGTHDSSRLASLAALDGRSGCRWPDGGGCSTLATATTDPAAYARIRRALAVLFTMPGIPFLYYGDEIAMPGGGDPDNRRDMIWDGALTSVAMGTETLSAQQVALRDFVQDLGRARADHAVMRRGRRITLIAESDVYAVAWAGDAPGELALMVTTRGAALAGRAIDGLTAGQLDGVTSFERVAGSGTLTRATGDRLRIDLAAGEVGVFVAH